MIPHAAPPIGARVSDCGGGHGHGHGNGNGNGAARRGAARRRTESYMRESQTMTEQIRRIRRQRQRQRQRQPQRLHQRRPPRRDARPIALLLAGTMIGFAIGCQERVVSRRGIGAEESNPKVSERDQQDRLSEFIWGDEDDDR